MKRRLGMLGIAAAGIGLGLCAHGALAQNTAQQAALARLNLAHTSVRALDTSSSSVEASNTTLDQPSGLTFDSSGNLFIADSKNHLIREVDLLGIISTVAGTGEQGFGGDGGAATSALLDTPFGVAVDAAGNVYIADSHNNRIREVSYGIITTIAGTGVAGFSGDGAAATAATLDYPTAIALDSNGSLYIADTNNNRIRQIATAIIRTVAGNGDQTYSGDGGLATAAGLDSPYGVAVDSAFNLYISDTNNQRIRMVTYSTGIISTLAGTGVKGFSSDGAATSSELASPRGIAVDSSGTIYIADSGNQRIRTITGGQLTTIAGNGEQGYTGDTGYSTSASFDTPYAVATYGGSIAIADTQNQAVRTATSNGVNTTAGTSTKQTESLLFSGLTTVVYGTGTLSANFSYGSNTATGLVTFYDGLGANPVLAGAASLLANTAVLDTSKLSAGTHRLVASYAGDSNNPAITSSVYVLVVTQASTTTTLTASSTTPVQGTAVTLNAAVASTTSGTPTGSVNFFNGTVKLNATPVALSDSVATLSVDTLPVGALSLTAVYSGNTNFTASTSPLVIGNELSADFSIAATPTVQSTLLSQSVAYTITLTPVNPTFFYPVSLSVSGLPQGVTASFAPASIESGSGTSTTVLTLNAGSLAALPKGIQRFGGLGSSAALALLFLPLLFGKRTRLLAACLSRKGRLLTALLALAAGVAISGCGGGFYGGHSIKSYIVTITAVCGPNTHTTEVTLTVQ